ncbi:hypothetical protein QFZ24_002106 [Streptomyces phaeochromogenes]|uniref:hypothetical protein n=1 Tax=Streptomyces phaeochromogenes TaxID=1923 RepID=UPI00278D02D5|nr:hypothetical protein [Streptomyces phaeochromogenes]MDQ0948183.1 hypothetical protein [Streptomyces phaeochromogenes]
MLRHARAHGARAVRASCRTTPKNTEVKDFYPRNGFVRVADDDMTATCRSDGTTMTYEHDVRAGPVPARRCRSSPVSGLSSGCPGRWSPSPTVP